MRARDLYWEIRERLGLADDWWTQVESDYGVSRREALKLGERAPGRRPSLPGSSTCDPVSGMTWEGIWNSKPRETAEAIESFWRETGSWCVFRQLVRHRGRGFPEINRVLPTEEGVLLEWGCGIAPVSWWLQRRRGPTFIPVLYDVPGEAFEFAKRRIAWHRKWTVLLTALEMWVDVAVCYEVLEHVPDPRGTMVNVMRGIKKGGYLFEDFYNHEGHGSPADLESAAKARPAVYDLIRAHCDLITGLPPEAPEGGGRRMWRKR